MFGNALNTILEAKVLLTGYSSNFAAVVVCYITVLLQSPTKTMGAPGKHHFGGPSSVYQ